MTDTTTILSSYRAAPKDNPAEVGKVLGGLERAMVFDYHRIERTNGQTALVYMPMPQERAGLRDAPEGTPDYFKACAAAEITSTIARNGAAHVQGAIKTAAGDMIHLDDIAAITQVPEEVAMAELSREYGLPVTYDAATKEMPTQTPIRKPAAQKTVMLGAYNPNKTVIMKAADKTALFEVPQELKATVATMPAYKR